MTHEESWNQNFELLKLYIEEHHHLPDKKKVENRGLFSWAKYQRKRIKATIIGITPLSRTYR